MVSTNGVTSEARTTMPNREQIVTRLLDDGKLTIGSTFGGADSPVGGTIPLMDRQTAINVASNIAALTGVRVVSQYDQTLLDDVHLALFLASAGQLDPERLYNNLRRSERVYYNSLREANGEAALCSERDGLGTYCGFLSGHTPDLHSFA